MPGSHRSGQMWSDSAVSEWPNDRGLVLVFEQGGFVYAYRSLDEAAESISQLDGNSESRHPGVGVGPPPASYCYDSTWTLPPSM